ncbi:23S rRNA (adenine(2503)-C(2))-methyltransferase RlmN [Pectinatus haikarae]|uniref:Probable dual-specificity RNA methyltransferase RlmN n=1 Tax=Pectinatus haikarae TaxID=349096 RepID=A0ABT9Y475_9FIRM|nr:23S rRNA (adenine(2503)-C(2))-methyltransferase RlmN [Pectinatus haikarae]MDQ0202626.1 23S rRNA (adenine2503-C2)-methyltransferase [Pectinatus haikarae]
MQENIFGLTLDELREKLKPMKVPSFRAAQILEWLYQKNIYNFAEMTNLPLSLREELSQKLVADSGEVVDNKVSEDGRTNKMLVRFSDKVAVETVLMRQKYGNSICISSQAGCSVGCSFCASTVKGLDRNMTKGEMLAQAMKSQELVSKNNERIGNIVIMGSGEPLLNYENVLAFIRLVHEKYCMNIGYRNITVSTSGIIPMMEKLAQENLPITLSLSLHAPEDKLRSELMPVNKRYPLIDVVKAADDYAEKTKRRVTYEYILINDINDSPEQAKSLAGLLKNKLANVNLIPINPVVERGFTRPSAKKIKNFWDILQKQHINATIRKEMGTDINAACGQLRNEYLDASSSEKTQKNG